MKYILRQKVSRALLLASVLLLGGYLRSVGLTWGLESGYGHFRNFHSDEFISLRGVLEIDLLRGRIKAPGTYFEGTFNYYLWALPVAAIKLAHEPGPKPLNLTDDAHFAQILFLCRIMTVAFDVLAIFVVFLAAYEAIQSFFPALFAGFFYSIIPMQVIYAHFMRTHALSNLLCALVLWVSLKLIKTPTRWLFLAAGIFSGLGAATRFPNCVIVAIPCLCLLFTRPSASTSWISQLRRSTLYLLSGPIWWIGLGFLGGLFIGEPVLFFDPQRDRWDRARVISLRSRSGFCFSDLIRFVQALDISVRIDPLRHVSCALDRRLRRNFVSLFSSRSLPPHAADPHLFSPLPLSDGKGLREIPGLPPRHHASISGILYPGGPSLQRFVVVIEETSSGCDFPNNGTALTHFTLDRFRSGLC